MNDRYVRIYGFDPEECKKDIEQSILFALDREKEHSKYEREKFKMIGYVSKYMYAINENENINYGVEIAEVTERCIKAYDPSAGTPFLAYFHSAWKNEYRIIKGKECQDQNLRGIHVNKKVMTKIAKYIRYARNRGIEYTSENFIQLISDEIDRSIEEVREYIKLIKEGVSLEEAVCSDEDTFSLFDFVPNTEDGLEDILDQRILMDKWIDTIEKEFDRLQERQKPIMSELLTMKIVDSNYADETIISAISCKSFFNREIFMKAVTSEKLTARTIAENHGVSEQSASRAMKVFLERIKNKG